MSPHVRLHGIAKRFGQTVVLTGVDLALAKGEFLTLLGPSGCGKTTLLRIVAGFLRQDEGVVEVAGRAIDDQPPHRRDLGMVFQNYAVFPHLTVFDNVAYGLRARRIGRAEIARRVAAALARVRLGDYGDRFPTQLSGGQKQRVGLARAIAIEPQILLMDEPLSNLDAKLRVEMRDEIRLLQQDLGITTIYVTHDQEEALAVSDRIAVLERGRVLQVGAPREIYSAPAHLFVADFIGGANRITARAEGAGARLAGGALLPLSRPAAAGAELVIAVRPEDVRLAAGEGATVGLTARLQLATYLGARVRLTCVLDDGAVVAVDTEAAHTPPAPGAALTLYLDPARAFAYGPGGAAL